MLLRYCNLMTLKLYCIARKYSSLKMNHKVLVFKDNFYLFRWNVIQFILLNEQTNMKYQIHIK